MMGQCVGEGSELSGLLGASGVWRSPWFSDDSSTLSCQQTNGRDTYVIPGSCSDFLHHTAAMRALLPADGDTTREPRGCSQVSLFLLFAVVCKDLRCTLSGVSDFVNTADSIVNTSDSGSLNNTPYFAKRLSWSETCAGRTALKSLSVPLPEPEC